MIGQVAASDVTIMITGESGTGKELIARALFQHSHRSNQPFIAVNCAAIPDNLIESELFGHEKGSFTGATNQRVGKFELCDEGTIFLDEIGDMSLSTQTKILRALQEGEIQRVGGTETIRVDVRVIAATNKSLETLVEEMKFREDLYYRLNVVRIRLPALRERMEDVPLLIDFMLQRLKKEQKVRVNGVSPEAMNLLMNHDWPGNVRELENVVYRSAVIAKGDTILVKDLPGDLAKSAQSKMSGDEGQSPGADSFPDEEKKKSVGAEVEKKGTMHDGEPSTGSGEPEHRMTGFPEPDFGGTWDRIYKKLRGDSDRPLLPRAEAELIQRALDETGGNQLKASKLLGITRGTLKKRIDEYDLRIRK